MAQLDIDMYQVIPLAQNASYDIWYFSISKVKNVIVIAEVIIHLTQSDTEEPSDYCLMRCCHGMFSSVMSYLMAESQYKEILQHCYINHPDGVDTQTNPLKHQCTYFSINRTIMGSENVVLPDIFQTFAWTNADSVSTEQSRVKLMTE